MINQKVRFGNMGDQYRRGAVGPGVKFAAGGRMALPAKRSPQIKMQYQSPSPRGNPHSEYISHLVPNQMPVIRNIQPIKNNNNQNNYSSVTQHYLNDSPSRSAIHKRPSFGTPTIESTAAVSRGGSVLSNKRSLPVMQTRNNQYCPPSPSNIRKLQPIRRISQHRVNISQTSEERSNRSQSQQNIRIFIETDMEKDSGPPPKITISHVQRSPAKAGSTIIRNHDYTQKVSVISNPIVSQGGAHYRPLTERAGSSSPKITFNSHNTPQPSFITSHAPPLPICRPIPLRSHSFSMDNKHFVKVNQQNSNLINSKISGVKEQMHLQQQKGSDFQQPISFNNNSQTPPFQQTPPSQIHTSFATVKEVQNRKSTTKPTLNISSQTQEHQTVRKGQKECYNEYYGEEQSQLPSLSNSKKQYNYLFQSNTSMSSKLLIHQIFQNQTNKALLKIQKIRSKSRESREKSYKNSWF